MAETWVTLRHTIHGGEARFPAASVSAWEAKGWRRPAAPETTVPVTTESAIGRKRKGDSDG